MSDALSEFLGLEEIAPMTKTYSGPMRASGSFDSASNVNSYNFLNWREKNRIDGEQDWEAQQRYAGKDFGTVYGGEVADYLNSSIFHNTFRSAAGAKIDDDKSMKDIIAELRAENKGARADVLQDLINKGYMSEDAKINNFNFNSIADLRAYSKQNENNLSGKATNIRAMVNRFDAEYLAEKQRRAAVAAKEQDNINRQKWEEAAALRAPVEQQAMDLYQQDFSSDWGEKINSFKEILKDPKNSLIYGTELMRVMDSLVNQYETYTAEIETINAGNLTAQETANQRTLARNRLLNATQDAANTSQNALNTYLEGQGAIASAQNKTAFSRFSGSRTSALQNTAGAAASLEAATDLGVRIKDQEAQTRMFNVLGQMLPAEQDNVLNSIGIELGNDIEANKLAVTGLLQNVENAIKEANLTGSAEGDRVSARLGEIKNILASEQLDRANAMQAIMMALGVASTVTSLITAGVK